ncbi:MAG: ABC transporter substrate-binding protein [Actinomycetota bacterium]
MSRSRAAGRRLFASVLFLVLVAAACGDSDDDATTDTTVAEATDSTESESTEAPDDTEAATDTTEAAPETTTAEGDDATAATATIGIVNIAPVAALELVNDGFTDGMGECAAVDATLDYRNAEGDGSQLAPIVAEFLDSDVDLILAISTPVLQATVAANEADGRGTPVLFGAVTDPFAAGAAAGPDDKPDWLAGWQADAPVVGMFDIAAEINPEATTIGVAYDPSLVNSVVALAKREAEAEARGWTVETATIGDSSEVGTAANSLATRDIDFFFVPTDSILVNGLAGMAQVADDFDIPMIAQDSGITQAGAAIGTGLDYYGDGRRNADYACQILSGQATPADFPIQQFSEELVAYSTTNAAAQGIEIPATVAEVGTDIG